MKKWIVWIIATMILMLGFPWFAVTFTGDSGMGICFLLFYVVNPLYAAVCGAFAGRSVKELWSLPIVTAILFLTGTWIFFEMGEPAFLLYGGCYFVIGIVTMLISTFVNKRKS